MNDFTGRRKTDRARRIGKGIFETLVTITDAMTDGPKLARIEEIDREIKELRQERDHLIKGLVEPGDLKVSKHFDPYWSKSGTPRSYQEMVATGIGTPRLTKCKGRQTSGRYHDAHPGCPYVEQIHAPHEFTLRD